MDKCKIVRTSTILTSVGAISCIMVKFIKEYIGLKQNKNEKNNKIVKFNDKDYKEERYLIKKLKTDYLDENGIKVSENYTIKKHIGRNGNILVVCDDNHRDDIINANIEQSNCNYVIYDENGNKLKKYGDFLISKGYDVKVLNISNNPICMSYKKAYYNPIIYLNPRTDDRRDVLSFIDNSIYTFVKYILINTKDYRDNNKEIGDAAYLLLTSSILYMVKNKKDWHIKDLINMLRKGYTNDLHDNINELDEVYCKLMKNVLEYKLYENFVLKSKGIRDDVIEYCIVKLTPFTYPYFEDLMNKDNIALNDLTKNKEALFIVTDKNDYSLFISGLLFNQLYDSRLNAFRKEKIKHENYKEVLKNTSEIVCMINDSSLCSLMIDNENIGNSKYARMSYIISIGDEKELDHACNIYSKVDKDTLFICSDVIVKYGKNKRKCNEIPKQIFLNKDDIESELMYNNCSIQIYPLGIKNIFIDNIL